MKLSKNFVKDYIDIDVDIKTLAEDMTRVGNEYDSAEKLINATKLIIGEVLECENHPDSDHLHVCKVNIGEEVLDIVCGAPNVRKGLKVIVAQVGAELPGDFKIKKGSIRGQESNGMLCSIAELGLYCILKNIEYGDITISSSNPLFSPSQGIPNFLLYSI